MMLKYVNLFRAGVTVVGMVVVIGGAWMAAGCGAARRSEPLVVEKRVPEGVVARGQVAFMRYCHQCHPGGSGGLGPALNDKPLPGALIKAQVRAGGGTMPAIGRERLSDADLDGVVAYMVWLRGLPTRE